MSDTPPRPGADPPEPRFDRTAHRGKDSPPVDPLALAQELLAQSELKPKSPLELANELLAQQNPSAPAKSPLELANELLAQSDEQPNSMFASHEPPPVEFTGPPPPSPLELAQELLAQSEPARPKPSPLELANELLSQAGVETTAPRPPGANPAIQAPRFASPNVPPKLELERSPGSHPAPTLGSPPPPPSAVTTQRMQAIPPSQSPPETTQRNPAVRQPGPETTQRNPALPSSPDTQTTQRMKAIRPDPAGTTQRMQAIPPDAQPPARKDNFTTQSMPAMEAPKRPPATQTQKMTALPPQKPAEKVDPWQKALNQSEQSNEAVKTRKNPAITEGPPPSATTTQKMTAMGNVTRLMPAVDESKGRPKSNVSATPTQRIQDTRTRLMANANARPAPKTGSKSSSFWELQAMRFRRLVDRRERITTDDVVVFTRQFAAMVTAGLQLHQSLYFYAEADPDGALNRVVHEVADKVGEGNSLSHAMRRYPDVFTEVYTGLIAAGESTGMLSPVLGKLADLSEKNQRIRKKVLATLTYPMVLLTVSGLCILTFLYFVLPMMLPIFTTLSVELPLPTKMLVWLSAIMKNPVTIGLLCLGPIALWFLWPIFKAGVGRNPESLRRLHRIPLEMPVVGRMVEKIITSRIMFSMATLLDSGYALNATLEKCERVAGNAEIAFRLRKAREMLVEGCSAAECLGLAGVFPNGAIQMIAVGEESASLSDMIARVARVYEDEVELALLDFAALLEPAILVGMGLVVGFIVLAAVMPTVQLLNNL